MKRRYNPKDYNQEVRRVKHQVFCVSAQQQKLKFDNEQSAEKSLEFLRPEDFPQGRMPKRIYKYELRKMRARERL